MPRRVKFQPRVREADLERRHCRELEGEGWKCWKQNGLGRAARPDRLLLGPNGESAMIEWKRPGEVPTALQAGELDTLEAMGHLVACCDSLASARVFVASLLLRRVDGWRKRWGIEHPHAKKALPSLRAFRG